jgi:hypothetical protein
MAALVAAFRASSTSRHPVADDARERQPLSRHDRRRPRPPHVAGVRPFHVRKIRDGMQDKPGKANNWLAVFKALMSFAAVNDWRDDNPAAGIKALKLGEHEPWPADVLERALAAAGPMTAWRSSPALQRRPHRRRDQDAARLARRRDDAVHRVEEQRRRRRPDAPAAGWRRLPGRASGDHPLRPLRPPFQTTGALQSRLRS